MDALFGWEGDGVARSFPPRYQKVLAPRFPIRFGKALALSSAPSLNFFDTEFLFSNKPSFQQTSSPPPSPLPTLVRSTPFSYSPAPSNDDNI